MNRSLSLLLLLVLLLLFQLLFLLLGLCTIHQNHNVLLLDPLVH